MSLLGMSAYVKSHCVSFLCVVYFCLFSPLKDRYAFSICLQLLGAKPPDPMYILGIHGGIFPPKIPPKNLSSFFLYLGLELSIVKKANNKTVV